MKESVIKWQTGLPKRSCFCIVTLCTGIVVGHVRFEVNNDYDRDYFKKYVKAWCSEMNVEPYKEDLQPYKKQETMEEFTINAEDIKSSKIVITAQEAKINCDQFVTPNKVEIILGDNFEVVEEDGKWFIAKKQNQYPKTYKECCDILGISTMDNDAQGYKGNLIIRFQELLIARDAYWKIAGNEMGLGKPWENNGKNVYVIGCGIDGEIIKDFLEHPVFRYVLAFPTKEMRDAIYENLKELIEICKELL